ncbi:hypothetical protein BDV59DRAFT_185824 [Aspergillus ambiguus]|uniref:involucrin repeat protein n=1 Tax=Aspergillus ambiguus TaxID=176160 RepID=UPI003CCD3FE7
MFKALMGGGRSSSDSRSSAKGSSSSRRRADSKASSTVSRKSSRGDDRDRGLGDLSAYPSSGSRSKRYADSAAGDSVASSYATADPGIFPPESDRTSRRRDLDDTDSRDRHRDGKSSRRRERIRSPSRERERTKPVRDDPSGDADGRDRASTTSRRERRRTQSGDTYTAPSGRFPADIMATPDHQFPGMTTTTGPGLEASPTVYDPHVQQQFPGQFPAYVAEPYRPPNPAGEAAEYYGDQGQSVADQPGVRPQQPLVIPNSQAHLQPASPVENPPPEPSTIGELGAAASYYNDVPGGQPPPQSSNLPSSKPPKPTVQAPGLAGPAVGAAAAYAAGHSSSDGHDPDSPQLSVGASPSNFVPAGKPPHKPSHSHGTGAAVGAAAAGAAAGYMLGHHHHSSSPDVSQYTMQNPDDVSLNGLGYPGPSMYPPHSNPPPYAAAGAAAAAGYAAHPSHPHHAAVYHGAPFPAGGLAFQPRQRGPLGKFIDFWRDPEGVGMYEDYTETIGVCKYCFEPGTTSRDAPRKHHYRPRRRSSDRYSSGSRVDKLSRYASSEDESRRRRKSRSSWLPGVLTGYAVKSLFNNKDFDDTYSVRTGQVVGSSYDSESVSTSRRSRTSRGVYRRSSRSRSRDRRSRHSHPDLHMTRYEDHRPRSRSRSRSSSGSKHTLRDAALGAAVGTAAMSLAKSRNRSRSRSRSPRKSKSRKSSSSDSSFVDISRPARRPVAGGFGSFFTASSENRKKRRAKKRRSIFSFNNSSSSSVDNDLAFGSAYARRSPGKLKKKGKKKDSGDVDAALLGLGAAATALAAKSHHRGRRRGEILAGKDSRSGPSDYASSATNDEGWEDLDSADQSSSSVSSALAFGDTGRFGDDSSHSSDSSASLWGWRWGSKKNKKKRTPKKDYLPAAAGVGAGVLGAAALAGRHRDSRTDSRDARTSSAGSLQQVAPIPTADPSRYETVNISSLPPEPAYVRPGAIPLQQPQPVTPVSQAVYTSQGESIHAYSAPAGPPIFDNSFGQYNYGQPSRETQWKPAYSEGPSNVVRPHRRSDSSPVPHTEPLEGVTATGLKRHSTLREQPSVQFDLTHEQEEKERRAARQQRSKRDSDRYDGVQLVDREGEMARRDAERESRRYDDRDGRRRRERDDDDEYNRGHKEKQSTSWIGDAAVGTMGAVAAAAILSKTSNDDSSETSQKRHDERRQKRRAERRRTTDESSVGSFPISDDTEERSYPKRDRSPSRRSTYPEPARPTPTYENYAEFFAPEGLRYSPDTYAQREPTSMPTIIEAVPASERSQVLTEELHPDYNALPWPVPSLKIIEPTPPQSLSGSVRGATSPIPATPEVIPEDKIAERQTTGSRVSWGEHELHEYEVPSTSSDHESVDHEAVRDHQRGLRDVSPIEEIPRSNESHSPKNTAKDFGTDVEFAATIAAATAATGFNPSIVTDNPMYHTRSSPPGAEKIDSWTEIVPGRDGQRGFVEGEVDTPQEKFIESEPLYDEPDFMTNRENKSQPEQPSIAQEVIAQLSQKKEDAAETAPEDYSMPGGFEPETSREGPKDDTRSVASAPMPGDFEDDSRRTHDFDVMGDAPAPAAEEGATEGKKKRRKRRSKRDSGDDLDDSVSIISSPARIGQGEEKEKRAEEKEKKSGGFLSSLFGSRVSEPVESNKSSDDRPASREVQSEIGPRTSDGPRRRRREGSSSRRSSGELAEDKENFNVESYKSSRQRREEKRRQRHEGILHSGEGAEDEKV